MATAWRKPVEGIIQGDVRGRIGGVIQNVLDSKIPLRLKVHCDGPQFRGGRLSSNGKVGEMLCQLVYVGGVEGI